MQLGPATEHSTKIQVTMCPQLPIMSWALPDGRTKSESVAIYHMMGMVYQQLAMSKLPDEVLILHVTCHSCASTFPTQITHMATCWVESTYDKLEEEEKA